MHSISTPEVSLGRRLGFDPCRTLPGRFDRFVPLESGDTQASRQGQTRLQGCRPPRKPHSQERVGTLFRAQCGEMGQKYVLIISARAAFC
jgi:hypothetical protein